MPSCRPSPSIEYPPPHFHIGELRGFAFFGPFIKALQRRWCFPCSLNSSIFFDASVAFGLIQYGARIISSEEADVLVERYRSMVVRSLSRGDPMRIPIRTTSGTALFRGGTLLYRFRLGQSQSRTAIAAVRNKLDHVCQ